MRKFGCMDCVLLDRTEKSSTQVAIDMDVLQEIIRNVQAIYVDISEKIVN